MAIAGHLIDEPFEDLWSGLEEARRAAGLSQTRFWGAYLKAGGSISFDAFLTYLRGTRTPRMSEVGEYNRAAAVLAEETGERVPIVSLVQIPAPRGGTRAAGKTASNNSYRWPSRLTRIIRAA